METGKRKNDEEVGNGGKPKRKKKVLKIAYRPEEPSLEVLELHGKHVKTMGIPGGVFRFYPEEAVYLVETGSAIIVDGESRELTTLECFGILEEQQVEMSRYEVFKNLKSTGLVVLRPRKSIIELSRKKVLMEDCRVVPVDPADPGGSSESATTDTSTTSPIPPIFPTLTPSKTCRMTELHKKAELVNFLGPRPLETFPIIESIRCFVPPRRNLNRCRPKKWKSNLGQNVRNWKEFEIVRRKAGDFLEYYKLNHSTKHQRPSIENVDYHVFSPAGFSHSLPAVPLFSVICLSASGPVLDVKSLVDSNVVLAIAESQKVNYIRASGMDLNLNEFLVKL